MFVCTLQRRDGINLDRQAYMEGHRPHWQRLEVELDRFIATQDGLPSPVLLMSSIGTIIPEQEHDRIVEKIAEVASLRAVNIHGIIAWRPTYTILVIDQAGIDWLEQWLEAHQSGLKIFQIGESTFVGNELFEFALNNRDRIVDLMAQAEDADAEGTFGGLLRALLDGVMSSSTPKGAVWSPPALEDNAPLVMSLIGVLAKQLKAEDDLSETSEQPTEEAAEEPAEEDEGGGMAH